MNYQDIITVLNTNGITDELEISHFLAQAHYESMGFSKLIEGENYRFNRAKVVWPSRKLVIQAKQNELNANDTDFCPQPWLFNLTYGSRLGNELNGTNDNDGYHYRGRGIFQLTGFNNYNNFLTWLHVNNLYLNLNMTNLVDFVAGNEGAIISAIWFWKINNIGEIALRDDVVAVTKKINGGANGLNDRIALTAMYKELIME